MLTYLKIKNLPLHKKVCDGRGLYLTKSSRKVGKWTYRFTMNGRAREMGLGPFPDISLDDARLKREECRKLQLQGIDPLEKKYEEMNARLKSEHFKFSHVAELYMRDNEASWTAKSKHQWRATLHDYAYPHLDKKPLDRLDPSDVSCVLRPIWQNKTETASRIQQRLARIFSYAITKKLFPGPNPAEWQNNLENIFPAAASIKVVTPMKSLDYHHMPDFFAKLGKVRTVSSLALQFLILTASRTIEVTHCNLDEFDERRLLWTVPAARMKARKEHKVPLTRQSLAIVKTIKHNHNHRYLFTGSNPDKPLCNNIMGKMMRTRFKEYNATVHGFRATFRNWAAETNDYDPYAVEFCLAHQIPNKSEAAYLRTSLLSKRKVIMQDWSDYVFQQK